MLNTKRNTLHTLAKFTGASWLANTGLGITASAANTASPSKPVWVMDKQPLLSDLHAPVGMAFDSQRTLYIANWGSGTISRLFANGKHDIFATGLNGPSGLAINRLDEIFVASYSDDVVWHFSPNGKRNLFVDQLATPAGLTFEDNGNLLIANRRTNQILAARANGSVSPIAHQLQTPVGAARSGNGQLFVSNIDGGISVIDAEGPNRGQARTICSALHRPGPGIVAAGEDAVFVVDYGGTAVHRVNLAGQSQAIVEKLSSPVGLCRSPQGDLLLTTWGDNALYRIRNTV